MFFIAFICIWIQLFLSTRKGWFWGILFPIFALFQVIYWLQNPIPKGHMPTMTAMNAIPWLMVLVASLILYFIFRSIYHKKK